MADVTKARPGIPTSLLAADARALVADAGADVVIELIGDGADTLELVTAAIDAGKSVVTANKALLATHLAALTARAADRGVDLFLSLIHI